ncbi:MAG TPA: hypothetical protein GXZ98_06890 [Firmicutes bacterium]|nr:hypothetical protein [Bacillota bacterium]
MRPKKKPTGFPVPAVVVKNFFFLNLLLFLTLVFSTFGLHFFLRPRALPTLARTTGSAERPKRGVMALWELETARAKRLLFEGLPILLRRSDNP